MSESIQQQNPQDDGNGGPSVELASRLQRFWASTIDGCIGLATIIPFMFWLGAIDYIENGQEPPLHLIIVLAIVGLLTFLALHGHLLKTSGQTIGKKLIGIRIVNLNNELVSLHMIVLKRYLPLVIVAQVPILGRFLSFIDAVFIFGDARRCLHDYVAGTKVMKAIQTS